MGGTRELVGIVTARMTSERLPQKVMLPLAGKPVLEHLIDRIKEADLCSDIVVATGRDPSNKAIAELAERCGVGCFHGEDEDVLDRFVSLMAAWDARNCIRFCADNPLTDMETTARLVALHREQALDYVCVKGLRLTLGLTEVISRRALEAAAAEAPTGFRRESITLFIRENVDRFRVGSIPADPFLHQSPFRLTLDYPEDYALLTRLFDELYDGRPIPYARALAYLQSHPDVGALNAHVIQKSGNRYWEELDAALP